MTEAKSANYGGDEYIRAPLRYHYLDDQVFLLSFLRKQESRVANVTEFGKQQIPAFAG